MTIPVYSVSMNDGNLLDSDVTYLTNAETATYINVGTPVNELHDTRYEHRNFTLEQHSLKLNSSSATMVSTCRRLHHT